MNTQKGTGIVEEIIPTNPGNMTKAIQKRIERILASAKMKKVQLINSEDFDALDNEDSYQLGELNGVIGTLEELLNDDGG